MSSASTVHDRGDEFAPDDAEADACRHHRHRHRCHDGFGPPLPIKLLGVAGAFWLAPPLGFAALGYWAWRACQRNGGGGRFEPAEEWRKWTERAPWRGGGRGRSSGNAAFDERRRETLRAIQEEAEAFAEFERRSRESRDRDEFERFMAERKAAEAGRRDEPKAPDAV
jgi:hypothetical protein